MNFLYYTETPKQQTEYSATSSINAPLPNIYYGNFLKDSTNKNQKVKR
jgi:hypothetical protein